MREPRTFNSRMGKRLAFPDEAFYCAGKSMQKETTAMRQSCPVRPLESDDLETVLQLNNAAVPTVNRLDAARLKDLVAQSEAALALGPVGEPQGFMLAMGPGLAYDSINYRWFAKRYDAFLYVDRIVVAESARGSGTGRALYKVAMERAAGRPLCCEVNLRPRNEPSLRFHAGLSFTEVGRQENDDGTKEVALLVRTGA
ncbi:GNAT family N-acetyltransferase [Aquibaculum arenosum]|uniref:GNAT family N-acetyltransferase n=1 Tax=Aquibaculum arenosum TaxID=3032591 RepID=A0ABT5YNV8_9PROT|nr:GNAT family N-acetyltransferase [Fodinicurvata sp. CAU 1616]MDF2096513.1 GNAT family N-acetyltransferase [Fodinicurvata sp. CAU 1616]